MAYDANFSESATFNATFAGNAIDAVSDEVIDIRTAYDGTVYPSAGDAVRGQISDLVEHTILEPITLSGYYIDDGGFIGIRENSVVYLYDITNFNANVIKAQISGTHNRCRLLLINDGILSVGYRTVGSYIDKGNSTTEFSLSADDLAPYKTLALCTNYSSTPYANVSMSKAGALDAYMRKNSIITKNPDIEFIDGYYVDYNDGTIHANTGYSYAKIDVGLYGGGTAIGRTSMTPNSGYGIVFTDIDDVFIIGYNNTTAEHYDYTYEVPIPENAKYFYISLRNASASDYIEPFFTTETIWEHLLSADTTLKKLDVEADRSITPVLRDGTIKNGANTTAVTMRYVMPIEDKYKSLYVEFTDSEDADKYIFFYTLFSGAEDGKSTSSCVNDSTITKKHVNDELTDKMSKTYIRLDVDDLSGYDHISIGIARETKDGTRIPIRIATDQYCLRMKWEYDHAREVNVNETLVKINNARHVKRNGLPNYLTLLHFSDIHGDTAALSRIVKDAETYGTSVDEIICTGDMVGNTYEDITGWWDADIMTCIGNHDCASYNSSTGYNWTALSMANRDAYYIAPFESNWGITHTSGTSYYYKDYSASNVRLIVMDAMLYSSYESDTSLGTAQTAWLENLLADAITNDLHVLIAIHAPHPDSVAKECSFSRYGQTAMPTESDCNTPQIVIDTVAIKINAGLKFVGYIVGHTHQDNIWDAEGDGTQLMYCVTCAAISYAPQWQNSDQHRSTELDAYNLVTIDTTNTLVKLVRGGGADIDDHMRTRKAICINYSTGAIVGEVL